MPIAQNQAAKTRCRSFSANSNNDNISLNNPASTVLSITTKHIAKINSVNELKSLVDVPNC